MLTLESAGNTTMKPQTLIPITRTSSPYSLTDAVSELTTNTAGTDTKALNQSLDTPPRRWISLRRNWARPSTG